MVYRPIPMVGNHVGKLPTRHALRLFRLPCCPICKNAIISLYIHSNESESMTAQIINGKEVSEQCLQRISEQVQQRQTEGKRAPGLAVILVGENPASAVYVRNKKTACQKCGIKSLSYELPEKTPQEELLALVDRLNADPEIDGILVQLPLPKHLDSQAVLERISPDKDVDGFHPYNVGRLAADAPVYPQGRDDALGSLRH